MNKGAILSLLFAGLIAGGYLEFEMNVARVADRLIVPLPAVLIRGSGNPRAMLFVYEPNGRWGLAKWRYVNLGEENGTQVEILSEGPEEGTVERGEIVLVDGHHYLAQRVPRALGLV